MELCRTRLRSRGRRRYELTRVKGQHTQSGIVGQNTVWTPFSHIKPQFARSSMVRSLSAHLTQNLATTAPVPRSGVRIPPSPPNSIELVRFYRIIMVKAPDRAPDRIETERFRFGATWSQTLIEVSQQRCVNRSVSTSLLLGTVRSGDW